MHQGTSRSRYVDCFGIIDVFCPLLWAVKERRSPLISQVGGRSLVYSFYIKHEYSSVVKREWDELGCEFENLLKRRVGI